MVNVCEEEGRWRKRIDERSREREIEREREGCTGAWGVRGITDVSIPRAIRPGVSGASTIRAPPSTTSTTLITRRRSMRPQAPGARPKIAPPRKSYTQSHNRRLGYSELLFTAIDMSLCVAESSRIPTCYFLICPRSPLLRFHIKVFKQVSLFEKFPINIYFYN